MAVNTITFGGVNSSSYGIYISGEGVFNAPVRDAEMISIPGRNGSFLLDNGRYENIEVTYPAFNTATDKATFIANIDAFRNAIASQKGYQRLEDTFHADEYRMASFIGGLEINPILHNDHTSQFEIVFNCKPQRFLKSGESAVSKANNSTITNPTLFDAHPLISFQASGNGTINLGAQAIEFFNAPLGTINLPFTVSTTEASADTSDYITFSGSYNTGDKFRVKGSKATFNLTASSTITSVSFPSGMDLRVRPNESSFSGTNALTTVEDWQETEFTIGTSSTVNKTYTPSYVYGGSSHTATFTLSLIYDGNTSIRMKWTATLPSGMTKNRISTSSSYTLVCDSTANSLTGDLYIDLDIGEAYKINNGSVVSINNFVNLGGELPTLPPGNTTITYSNTISNFKITPRWWKI